MSTRCLMPVPNAGSVSYPDVEYRLARTLAAFSSRYDNLRRTLECLIDSEQLEAAAHLADCLGPFWESYDYLDEGGYWLDRILNHEDVDHFSPLLKGKLLISAGHLARHRGDYQQARILYQRGLSFVGDTDYRLLNAALSGLGETAFRQGHYDEAEDYYRQYWAVSQQAQDQAHIANALGALGPIVGAQGDFQQASELYNQSRSSCARLNYKQGLAWALSAIGELERTHSNYDRAANLFAESARIFSGLCNYGCVGYYAHPF